MIHRGVFAERVWLFDSDPEGSGTVTAHKARLISNSIKQSRIPRDPLLFSKIREHTIALRDATGTSTR